MVRRVRFRAIHNGFRTENFEKIPRPQNFAFGIARDRAEIHAAWWCTASSKPLQVPDIYCERQHAVPREISSDSERIWDRIFRKFSRPQNFSFEIARDRAKIHAACWCAASPRPSVWASEVPKNFAERRHAAAREIACDSQRISDRNFRKIFAAAKFCVRNRARSRRNPHCPTTPSLASSQTCPQTLCRASARCGA